METEVCVFLRVFETESYFFLFFLGGRRWGCINRNRLAGSRKRWLIDYGGRCDGEVMVLVRGRGGGLTECVWAEILITGVRRVTLQLMEAASAQGRV